MNKTTRRIERYLFPAILALLLAGLVPLVVCAQQGGMTRYTYDDNGRLRSVTLPNGDTEVYQYDAAGNIVSITRQRAPLPTISGFTPATGTPGTGVSISGANFDTIVANNQIRFNGAATTATSATATTLTANVPAGATSGRLTVATLYGSATSTADFFVPPSPFTTADVAFTDRMSIGQTKQVTINTANKIALVVFDGVAGQHVGLSAINLSLLQSVITIYKPDGAVLVSASPVTPFRGFVGAPVLPVTGTYTILVAPIGTNTGGLTLSLGDITDITGSITVGGPPVTVTTTAPGQNARLTFSGTAGQHLGLTLNSQAIPTLNLSVIKPDGTSLPTTVSGVSNGTIFLEPATLPVSGTYTLLIEPLGGAIGSMTLTLAEIQDVTTTIAVGGPPVTVTTTAQGQNAKLIFNGTQGQNLTLNLSNNTFAACALVIYKPDGSILGAVANLTTAGGPVALPLLPATGTYTILVDPPRTFTGSLTLALVELPPDALIPITVGGPAVTIIIATPGQNVRLAFNGTAGQQVSLQTSNVALTPAGSAYVISIIKPDGTTLASQQATSNTLISTTTLPVSGSYTILVAPSPGSTGSMVLKLNDAGPAVGSITPGGAPVTANVPPKGQDQAYAFSGTAGQRVSLVISNKQLFTGSVRSGTIYVFIKAPNGTTLAQDTNVNTSSTFSFIDALTLPVNGTYTIVIQNPFGVTGSVTLTLYDIVDVTGPITPVNFTGTTGMVPESVTVTLSQPGQNARLTFNGMAGERFSVFATSPDFNFFRFTLLNILKPDGTSLGVLPTSSTASVTDFQTLPVTGTYTVLIDPQGMQTGSATVTLYRMPADFTSAIVPGGDPVTVNITSAGQNGVLTFNGTQARKVILELTDATMSDVYVVLLDANGNQLTQVAVCSNFCGISSVSDPVELPTTGTYTIVVHPNKSPFTGSVTVTLYDIPPNLTGSITLGGPPVTVDLGVGQEAFLTFNGTAGQQVSLNLTNVTLSPSLLFIYKPNGFTLISRTNLPASGTFFDAFTLPTTGTYTIEIDHDTFATGQMTLNLYNVPDITGTLTVGGPAASVTIPSPGQNAKLTFSGTAGQAVTVQITGNTISPVSVTLLKPDGTSAGAGCTGCSGDFSLTTITLPVTGTYTVKIDPVGPSTGRLNVSVTSP
jgi:YD repeat-containing protein